MQTFLIFLTFFLAVSLYFAYLLVPRYINELKEMHEKEIEFSHYTTEILISSEANRVKAELYSELLGTRERDKDWLLSYIMQKPTSQPLPYCTNTPQLQDSNAVTVTDNAVTDEFILKFTFNEGEEGITKKTRNSAGVYLYKGDDRDFAPFPIPEETSYFENFNLYLKKCKNCSCYYVAKSENSQTCSNACKQAHHRKSLKL